MDISKLRALIASLPEDEKKRVKDSIKRIEDSIEEDKKRIIEEALKRQNEKQQNESAPQYERGKASYAELRERMASLPEDEKKRIEDSIKRIEDSIEEALKRENEKQNESSMLDSRKMRGGNTFKASDAKLNEGMGDLKIDTSATDITAASSSDSVVTPFNVNEIIRKWTPEAERDKRVKEDLPPKYSAYDAENNHLCGGDYLFNEEAYLTTISFLFQHGEDNYGLTVGHLARKESRLFTFATGAYESSGILIGKVVEVSTELDALIFKLEPNINADFYQIRLSDREKHRIDLRACVDAYQCVIEDEAIIIGRGAVRRGTHGQFRSKWKEEYKDEFLRPGDISIVSKGDEEVGLMEISSDGDCGMIMLNENGHPLSMHKGLLTIDNKDEENPKPYYESLSTPLCKILSKYKKYFPVDVLPEESIVPEGGYATIKSKSQQTPRRTSPKVPPLFLSKWNPRRICTSYFTVRRAVNKPGPLKRHYFYSNDRNGQSQSQVRPGHMKPAL